MGGDGVDWSARPAGMGVTAVLPPSKAEDCSITQLAQTNGHADGEVPRTDASVERAVDSHVAGNRDAAH